MSQVAKTEDEWEVTYGLDTLLKAKEIERNKVLMAKIKKLAKKRKEAFDIAMEDIGISED